MPQANPTVSIIVPAYNAAGTIVETLNSLLNQTYRDYEIVVVDDGSTDATPIVIRAFLGPQVRVVAQANRGLAGARNTGLHHARGQYAAFCDADDIWEPEKLDRQVHHLDHNPEVGISFAGSRLIDDFGNFLRVAQNPKLTGITLADIFKRNPIGNGSAAVVRREAFDCIAYRPPHETSRDWWFDETLRQSEDIDAWLRFALSTDWRIEGIPGHLTRYRVNSRGLSANLAKQYETWKRVRNKVRDAAPAFCAQVGPLAEAYQLRFLARRAFMMGDGAMAFSLVRQALKTSPAILAEEPVKTLTTLAAALALRLFSLEPAQIERLTLAGAK